MSNIKAQKSPEVLQAQLATFTAEQIAYYEDSGYVFDNLGELALRGIADLDRVTVHDEYLMDEAGITTELPRGTTKPVATSQEYAQYLRSVGGSRYEAIQGRASMLEAYAAFAPAISALRAELADPTTRQNHPAFIGRGSNSMVFAIEQDGKKYAVRVPVGKQDNPHIIDSHLGGGVLGRGVPHLEQIVAASYENSVTIAELLPGKEMGDLTVAEITQITDKTLAELVDTLAVISEKGIEIDPNPSNFLYDPQTGIGLIDYHPSKIAGKSSEDQDLGKITTWMCTALANAGIYGQSIRLEKTPADYEHELGFHTANLGVMRRYREIVEAKLNHEDLAAILEAIDRKIQVTEETIANYSDPLWVAECIAKAELHKKQRRENARRHKIRENGSLVLDVV